MFWNDRKEIKSWMVNFSSRLTNLEMKLDKLLEQEDAGIIDFAAAVKNIKTEYHAKIDEIHKFTCENKEFNEFKMILKIMVETCQRYYNKEKNLDGYLSKIDAIYAVICQKQEKKPRNTGKNVKKTAVFQDHLPE
jgi:hypothetical protein